MSAEVQESAIEEQLFTNAKQAAAEFAHFSTEQVEKIVQAVGMGCAEKSEFYAEWAVRDTGFGNLADKIQKKQLGSSGVLQSFNAADYIEPVIDKEKKIISYPRPAGVVVGLMPCTNPVSTVFMLSMYALFSRNSIILCPHPAALECCEHATDLVAELAEAAGAPKNTVQILREPSIPTVNAIMHHRDTNLILAIGGPGMVHAAYSSGNPTIGVGAANVPCYIHETADPVTAGMGSIISSSFDNSLPCTTESVILVDVSIADAVKENMQNAGGLFISGEEEQKLRDYCWPEGEMNPEIVGKDPSWLAEKAGFSIPEGTKTMVIEITEIGYHEPVSREKLWPVLGFKVINGGVDEAIKDGLGMLDMMGKGHSAAVYSTNSSVIAKWGHAMPVCRTSVNAPNALGASGILTNLEPSLMIGTGFYGGSSSDNNVTPAQLVQWSRVAYNNDPAVIMNDDIDAAVAAVKD